MSTVVIRQHDWWLPFVLTILMLVSGAARAAERGGGIQSAEREVRLLNANEVEAFLRVDHETLAGLWSDEFVVTNPQNRLVTKQQVLGMVESGALVIASLERQIEYLRILRDTAMVAGSETVTWGGGMPNAGKTEHLRFTATWMKLGRGWQEVARHASVIPP